MLKLFTIYSLIFFHFLLGDGVQSYFTKESYDVIEIGIMHPDEKPVDTLYFFVLSFLLIFLFMYGKLSIILL